MGRFASPRASRGQAGYALPLVIGVTLLLTLLALALFTYIFTSMRVTQSAIVRADGVRDADSALEVALQEWRFDEALVGTSCSGTTLSRGDVEVGCSNPAALPLSSEERVMDLEAEDASGTTVGSARVRVVDEVNGVRAVGHSVEVCDWLVGSAAAREPLRGCRS